MKHSPYYVGVYTSSNGILRRKEVDRVNHKVTLVTTTWDEEHARAAKKEEK